MPLRIVDVPYDRRRVVVIASSQPCITCAGSGKVVRPQGFFMIETLCPDCHGRGAAAASDATPDLGCRSAASRR
jgi:DnaJ-class molecular chaperone